MPADPAPSVSPPAARLESGASGAVLRLSGAWRLATLPVIQHELTALSLPAELSLDGAALTDIDTASALALLNHLRSSGVNVQRLPWQASLTTTRASSARYASGSTRSTRRSYAGAKGWWRTSAARHLPSSISCSVT